MIAIREGATREDDLIHDALIRYYCVAHKEAVQGRSPLTIHRDGWAYCVAGGTEGHEWMAIEPISDSFLRWCRPRRLQHE